MLVPNAVDGRQFLPRRVSSLGVSIAFLCLLGRLLMETDYSVDLLNYNQKGLKSQLYVLHCLLALGERFEIGGAIITYKAAMNVRAVGRSGKSDAM